MPEEIDPWLAEDAEDRQRETRWDAIDRGSRNRRLSRFLVPLGIVVVFIVIYLTLDPRVGVYLGIGTFFFGIAWLNFAQFFSRRSLFNPFRDIMFLFEEWDRAWPPIFTAIAGMGLLLFSAAG